MKILILSSEFPPNVGGIGNHGYNVALHLSKRGHDVLVIADSLHQPMHNLKEFEAQQNFKIHWIPRHRFTIITYLHRIFSAFKAAKKVDVVLCSGKFSLWTGGLLRWIKGEKKLFAVVHGSELDLKSKWAKKLTQWSLDQMAEIISVSNYTSTYLPSTIFNKKNISIVPNGITCHEFHSELTHERKPIGGSPSIITLGNVSQRKGQINVIQALPHLVKRFPNIHYHIVGKPSEKDYLEAKARELHVLPYLTFHGIVSRERLMELLHGSDIKAMLSNHTSTGDFEGFGIAVLEANILGVPAIGSRNSGIADAIDHEKTGCLIDQHNPFELVNAIEKIMNNYSEFSKQAKNWAINHDWEKLIQEYEAIALKTASTDK